MIKAIQIGLVLMVALTSYRAGSRKGREVGWLLGSADSMWRVWQRDKKLAIELMGEIKRDIKTRPTQTFGG